MNLLIRDFNVNKKIVILFFVIIILLLHFLTNNQYGIHHDELYFVACGQNLNWGYVDHNAFTPLIAKISNFNNSLFILRLLPALASCVMVILIGLIVLEFEGNTFALILSLTCYLITPSFLRAQNMLCIPAFEPVFWTICFLMIIKIIKKQNYKLWLIIGLSIGIGFNNKPTILLLAFGIIIGLLFTKNFKAIINKWFIIGVFLALLFFIPNIIWQINNHFPTLEFIRNLKSNSLNHISLFEFIIGQIFYLHPFNFPIWILGLYFFLINKKGKDFRVIGLIYFIILIVLLITKSKIYYFAPIYPVLFASGSVMFWKVLEKHRIQWGKFVSIVIILIGGIITLPLSLPVFPIEKIGEYVKIITFNLFSNSYEVVNDYYGMIGWSNYTKEVSDLYNKLPIDVKKKCIILGNNYSNTSAINYFGKKYNLPNAISGNMTYYLWGPGENTGEIIFTLGFNKSFLMTIYNDVEYFGSIKRAEIVDQKVTNIPDKIDVDYLDKYFLDNLENQSDKDFVLTKLQISVDRKYYIIDNDTNKPDFNRLLEIINEFEFNEKVYLCKNPKTSLKENWSLFKSY